MKEEMNALAPAQAAPLTGPSLDNKRVAAGLIDLVVLFLFGFLLGTLAGNWTAGTDGIVIGWSLYYYFALESMTGQTVGKRAMGLKVVRADGTPADMRDIAIRTVLRLVDGLGLYLVGLAAMLATGERRQRLGDLAAGTVVTTAETAPSEVEPAPARVPAPLAPTPVADAGLTLPTELESGSFEQMTGPGMDTPTHVEEAGPKPGEPIVGEPTPPAPEATPGQTEPGSPIEIVSPIDLVMADDEEEPTDRPVPPPPPGDQAA
jgi:uncharacterized RDD family membrane protein YckC